MKITGFGVLYLISCLCLVLKFVYLVFEPNLLSVLVHRRWCAYIVCWVCLSASFCVFQLVAGLVGAVDLRLLELILLVVILVGSSVCWFVVQGWWDALFFVFV